MRTFPRFLLLLSGLALAIGLSRWPLRWYLRGGLLAGGLAAGILQITSEIPRRESAPGAASVPAARRPAWGAIAQRTLLLLLWSEIALLGARYLTRSALPYFGLDAEGFGRLAPHRAWLFAHIAGGMSALVLGPIQFWPGLRARALSLHRWIGRGYALGVLFAGLSAFHLAWYIEADEGGVFTGVSMDILAIAWLTATGLALRAILKRRVQEHREWMIRSYALTLAFVTIRWQLDWLAMVKLGPASVVTPYVIWVAWGVPLAATEAVLRRARRRGGPISVSA